ncbi:unnamed protein product [Rotaria sordida]|uniref:Uncharacterized protein n=1 Tax=Rotaria sordida TaxID=392033 RepID=A0A814GZK0_9BILA|nr:unnamed protein product [Rotaria sordida]CAF1093288.1 unnamed protein product [Rotaria sordida]
MNITNNSLSIFPSSSFGFNHNHQEFNEDNTNKISSSTSLDMMDCKNNNFPSMMIINDQQDESMNEDKDSFHRESSFYFYIYSFIVLDTIMFYSFFVQFRKYE